MILRTYTGHSGTRVERRPLQVLLCPPLRWRRPRPSACGTSAARTASSPATPDTRDYVRTGTRGGGRSEHLLISAPPMTAQSGGGTAVSPPDTACTVGAARTVRRSMRWSPSCPRPPPPPPPCPSSDRRRCDTQSLGPALRLLLHHHALSRPSSELSSATRRPSPPYPSSAFCTAASSPPPSTASSKSAHLPDLTPLSSLKVASAPHPRVRRSPPTPPYARRRHRGRQH